jgi:L-tartrate/succinate antiporter
MTDLSIAVAKAPPFKNWWAKYWRAVAPLLVALALAAMPAPEGLAPHGWLYFSIFAGVVAGLILEPAPGAVVGLIGVTFVSVLSRWTWFSPADLEKPGFDAAGAVVKWALSGFSNSTIWLIFGAFMFALGYEKTGLGRRIALVLIRVLGRRTLTLGYAIVAIETLLAPFIPSNTARTGGTLFPVIRCLPPLYGSLPNDPSARRIGSYLMWTSISASCVASSLFLTAFAPNLLALEILKKTAKVDISWTQWFLGFAPAGIPLLLVLPLVVWLFYPPQVRQGGEVIRWATDQLNELGAVSWREVMFGLLVVLGLVLWIFGGTFVNATTVVLIIICLMLVMGIVDWQSITEHRQAWNTLVWFATLIAMADGLNQTGFVKWSAGLIGSHLVGLSPIEAAVLLVTVFFFSHYLFASGVAHVTAMLPVMLAVGATVPGLPVQVLALMLVLTLGIMGIISPYGTGPSPIFFGSGYLPTKDYWRLGGIFGLIYFMTFMAVAMPILLLGVN